MLCRTKQTIIMNDVIFNKLLEKSECISWSRGDISFSCEYYEYSLLFGEYTECCKNNYGNISVSEFGYTLNGVWVEVQPSLEQLKSMNKLIEDKVIELNRVEEVTGFDCLDYRHFDELIYN